MPNSVPLLYLQMIDRSLSGSRKDCVGHLASAFSIFRSCFFDGRISLPFSAIPIFNLKMQLEDYNNQQLMIQRRCAGNGARWRSLKSCGNFTQQIRSRAVAEEVCLKLSRAEINSYSDSLRKYSITAIINYYNKLLRLFRK